ncbi:hypothetical protein HHI36_009065 [Cryptolaemus montrouzieri]|uniref:RNA polymerase I-specific transcription initiation factor RRN3 n=1 Tax=Cryptolaemus montrouzieri TaxID=559131 RepID=A0ABD2MUB5_9CUCU
MSVCSGQSFTPSILKKSSTLQDRLKLAAASENKVRFVLPHTQNIRNILRDYLQHRDTRAYENLIRSIRDSEILDADLISLLQETSECVSLLSKELRLFVEVLLTVRWVDRDEKLVKEYQSFLVNLLVAQNYHAKAVIDHLVSNFIASPTDEPWTDGNPSDKDCIKCINIHSVLHSLIKIVPMCTNIILNSLISHYPYFKKGIHINEFYLHNLLWIFDYETSLRPDILHLIFSKLVIMDVNAPREVIQEAYSKVDDEEIFSMDDTKSIASTTSSNVIVETLDTCMIKMLNYISQHCYNAKTQELEWGRTEVLYRDLLQVFDAVILPTYNCHHVQFCWFVLCGFKPILVNSFLDHLWRKVIDPNIPSILRQSSVEYIASLVARASYVTLKMLKSVLQQLATWIHTYINTQDGLECVNSDLRLHAVFYSTCQALFYATIFRHKEMIGSSKNIAFLQSLNFTKIVTCRLNPLRVCQPAVVQKFAAFSRNYQIVYCYSVIEHNSRKVLPTIYQSERGSLIQSSAVLEANYPFDPFVLRRAGEKICPFYREYEETDISRNDDINEHHDSGTTERDDFLDQDFHSSKCSNFSYGKSPGFKFNM